MLKTLTDLCCEYDGDSESQCVPEQRRQLSPREQLCGDITSTVMYCDFL